MNISGRTKLVGIIGEPLEHSLSPTIHNAAFDYLGLDWCYVPLRVRESQVVQALEGLRALDFIGFNVTMPLKTSVMPFLDEVAMFAESVGAVNTVYVEGEKLIGYNTDGRGFLNALTEELGFDVRDRRVFIAGAGGAARSVSVSLALGGARSITVFNRTEKRAEDMKDTIHRSVPDVPVEVVTPGDEYGRLVERADVLINAVPRGRLMGEHGLAFSMDAVSRGQVVCDLNYSTELSDLLREAESRGARVMDGRGMLLYQAAAAFEIWTGLEAPVEVMRRALAEALEEARI